MWRTPSLRRLRRLQLNRYWRAFFLALTLCAAAGTLVVWLAPELAGLFLLGIYSIPSNSIIPVPHEPGILYFAKFYHPALVALVATVGTVIVCFADYAIVEAAMRHPKISGAREARLFRWSVKWMTRYPFLIIVLFTLTPLPIYVVRVLAPASGYPIGRYILAQIVGRFPRFLALAYVGYLFPIPGWALAAMFVALLVAMWLGSRSTGAAAADDEEEEEIEDAVELDLPDLTDPEHPRLGASGSALPRAT